MILVPESIAVATQRVADAAGARVRPPPRVEQDVVLQLHQTALAGKPPFPIRPPVVTTMPAMPNTDALHIPAELPRLKNASMLLALTGWMDGGDVSTGTVRRPARATWPRARVAEIDPEPFYIYNFPGSMEIAALFRPEVKYEDGVDHAVRDAAEHLPLRPRAANLVFFLGKEPNLRWRDVRRLRLRRWQRGSASAASSSSARSAGPSRTRASRGCSRRSRARSSRTTLQQFGVRLTDYEGPALLRHLPARPAPAEPRSTWSASPPRSPATSRAEPAVASRPSPAA